MLSWILPLIWMLPVAGFCVYLLYSRSRYKNRKGAGAFFFEDESLVLNTGLPYAIPLRDLDHVELCYNSWELTHQLSYGLWVKAVRKNGMTKRVFYKGYGTARLAYPADMEAALRERGVCCVMVDSAEAKKK